MLEKIKLLVMPWLESVGEAFEAGNSIVVSAIDSLASWFDALQVKIDEFVAGFTD